MIGSSKVWRGSARGRRRNANNPGFTLIELMIAMVLGLLVVGGVVSVFLATQQTYRASEALGDVQDGARIAFDMMARDIREAGLTGCYSGGSVGNVLNNGPNNNNVNTRAWWANWGNPSLVSGVIQGYAAGSDPVAAGQTGYPQAANTESLQLIGASDSSASIASHIPATSTFTLNETSSTIQKGDVVVICDPNHAVITQVTSYTTGSPVTLTNTTSSALTGNCSADLTYPSVCAAVGISYTYGMNSQIAKLTAADWYVATNSAGTNSLIRVDLQNITGVPTPTPEEMVRGVTSLKILYHQAPNMTFVSAATVSNWSAVDSVQVTLSVQSSNQLASTNAPPITRTFTSTSTLRNRVN